MGKKIILLITLFAFFSVNAQKSKREEGIKFGIKGGLNISNLKGKIENNTIRTGLNFGILTEIILTDNYSFQPELLYSGQGFRNEDPTNSSVYKFDYIIMPLLVKYYVINNLSIETGPQLGLLINSLNRSDTGNESINNQKIFDFGLDFGLGFQFSNSTFLQARYNLGITNVNGANNADANKYTNSVFQISIGSQF